MSGRRAALSLAFLLLIGGAATAAAQECGVARPVGWDKARVAWFGPCVDGRAEGDGVLRAYVGGKPGEAFFGHMTRGAMVSGVMETDSGFAAGRFANGQAIDTDDRRTLIDGFRTGAAGARAASAWFAQQKNAGSAKFYADKAAQLARQMD